MINRFRHTESKVPEANVDVRIQFTQGHWDLPRHSSHVAQLLSLGSSLYPQSKIISLLLAGE